MHLETCTALIRPRGGTLGISGWVCAAETLEPLTYNRASSAEFCYRILEYIIFCIFSIFFFS